MGKYRTHHCNELKKSDVGQNVRLAGWVDTIRDHGGVVFIDLRDHYGITQIVVNDSTLLADINKESVISVAGLLRERAAEAANPKLATGEIELQAESISLLGSSLNQLPFEIGDSKITREDIRLKYRYLDLRNPEVHRNIIIRCEIVNYLRKKMRELGFLEIHTPILTSSSPEGARDYLVPSRKHHGKFYALPQAPQQFKQLLMVSGFDRYFQIAPCFRDEDARADRSPGEFYQLDFEMAFATQEDVFTTAENVLYDTFFHFAPEKKISPAPFVRIPYAEAMMKYGSDKPDLRNPLIIEDLTGFFADVDFAPFRDKPVRGIAIDCTGQPNSFYDKMNAFAVDIGMKGLGYITAKEAMTLKGPIVKFLSTAKQAELIEKFSLQENMAVFFISDSIKQVNGFAGQIRAELAKRLDLIESDSYQFCYVIDYPMYGINEDSGAIEFTHNPFSMPQGEMDALLNLDPLEIKAYQYDIVCNGVELSSGAVRNHRPDVMVKAFEIAGYTREDIETKFSALFNAFHYGAPPHAGMAPGLDRIVMLLTGQESIREVIAFPLNSNAEDILMGAPGEVTEQQLREVHIKVR
ncbi:MAG: aspartate--tRNA ligase [Lachnospiraceae bacterium]|jgi:aspartyl-tRNA synthetase|nr:aspartate--tRNA ligase [Lachnospiraceae bacterium]